MTLQRFENLPARRSSHGVAILLLGAMLLVAPSGWAAAGNNGAVLTGVVRDTQGVAQMGALVQVLAAGSLSVSTAFTDAHGRYAFASLVPGRYQLRASAALFVPATRTNLQLATGARAVVNLTLAALFDTASWIPASRRRADEPEDDWQWTLRSTANRPILRILDGDEEDDAAAAASPAGGVAGGRTAEGARTGGVLARGFVSGGDGGFGQSGIEDGITLRRTLSNGIDAALRAELGTALGMAAGSRAVSGAPETVAVQASFGRRTGYGGGSRTVIGYSSHPELVSGSGQRGMEILELRSGQQVALGENVELEIGGEADLVQAGARGTGGASAMAAHPFLRITAHPGGLAGGGWRLQYRLASSRTTQEFADLNTGAEKLPAAVSAGGSLALESGRHQEVSLTKTAGRGRVEVAFCHEALQRTPVAGTGYEADSAAAGNARLAETLEVDPLSGAFRAMANGYTGDGARITFSTPLSPEVWIAAEYATGAALASDARPSTGLADALAGLKPRNGQAVAVALKGDLKASGTRIRASYRWQPGTMVTAIDPYGALSDQGYLSFFVRQRLRSAVLGGWLPPGLDATIDVTNLLAQGYRPFLSDDGRTLYFAQAPRTIQAGLSFSF